MKNNTKLIMETWRRFLSEGLPDDPGQMEDPEDPVSGSPVSDSDLEGDQSYYSPASEEPSEGYYDEDYNPQGFDPDAPSEMSPRDRDRQFRSDYSDAIESGMSHDEAMKDLDSDESFDS